MAQTDTQPPAGHEGPPPPYMVYDIDATLIEEDGTVRAEWKDVQELWLEPPNIAVRRTRELPDGTTIRYEDRGTVNEHLEISGTDGFGGKWSGHAFPELGEVYTAGEGPKASFSMQNWTPGDRGEERCLRVLTVKEPVRFLTEDPLPPGKYYIRTFDHLRNASGEVPDEMKRPLSS